LPSVQAWRQVAGVVVVAATAIPASALATPTDVAPDRWIYQLNVPVDAGVAAVSAAAILVPYVLSSRIIMPSCPCSRDSVNAFDRGAIGWHSDAADWISTATVGLALGVPVIADWLALKEVRPWLEDLGVFVEVALVNGALVTGTKYLIQRPIPLVYSDPRLATDAGNYRSFYSGHTSLAFAALSAASVTIDRRYGLTWEPWAVTVILGSSVAAERVLAGRHFYSDVIIGAATGTLVGVVVTRAHLRSRSPQIVATAIDRGSGVVIGLSGPM
jgi:membrane-associated phospholipid phosphatase